jgi:hypothetical protein
MPPRTWTDPAGNDAHSLSPQKRAGSNRFLSHAPSSSISSSSCTNSGPSKLTYSQRKAVEKEEEEYEKMFHLFGDKPEIQYLNSREDDRLAASVYSDAKTSGRRAGAGVQAKPKTSGYDFGELLKNEAF